MWVIGGPYRDELVEIDVDNWEVVRKFRLDNDHTVVRATPDSVWLESLNWIRRVDTRTGEIGAPIEMQAGPGDVAVTDSGDVWVSLPRAAQLARVHSDGTVTHVDVGAGPEQIAADGDTLWVSHPPLASVSRIDSHTGEVLDVIDLDLSAGEVVSATTGALQATADGLWVLVDFPGSKYHIAYVLLDHDTGDVIAARSVPFLTQAWEAVDGAIWVHRLERGSVVRADVEDLGGAPTDPSELLPPAPPTAPPATMTTATPTTDDERDVIAALELLSDLDRPSSDLDLGPLEEVRDRVNELAATQPEPRVAVTDTRVEGDRAQTTFDIVGRHDVIILPGIVLEWRLIDGVWRVEPATYCRFAAGIGIPCPPDAVESP
jgi:hypothetical protein